MQSCKDSRGAGQQECVKVAVNIRALITSELVLGCDDCVSVVPGEPQVQIGSHAFTFDHVYGSFGTPPSLIFQECIAPLVDALFHGYNATVLAYRQTCSGKTYTMGTNYSGETNCWGIIPQVRRRCLRKSKQWMTLLRFYSEYLSLRFLKKQFLICLTHILMLL